MSTWLLYSIAQVSPVKMVTILSEDVHQSIIVGLAPGQTDGSRIEVLLKESLQFSLGVIFIQADQLANKVKDKHEVLPSTVLSTSSYPSIFEQDIERAPFTEHINHTR